MNVKLDTIVLLQQRGAAIKSDQWELLDRLKESIIPKLSSLKVLIRKEEKKQDCYIMFHLVTYPTPELQLLPYDSPGIKITLQGYSGELKNEIYKLLGDNKFASRVREQSGSILN